MTVLERVIKKSRAALAARIPIIYIKTDSRELIRQLIASDMLVMRLCGQSGGPEWKGRPLKEHFTPEIANYSEGLPASKLIKAYGSWQYPHIHVCKAENTWKLEEYQAFEEYILDHENEGFGNYEVLQSSVMIIFSSQVYISTMMQMYTEFIEVDLPDREEIHSQLLNEAYRYGDTQLAHNEDYLSELCTEFAGFSTEEIMMTMRKVMARETKNHESPLHESEEVIKLIREHKKNKMPEGILTLRTDIDAAIGGMKNLTNWLGRQEIALKQAELLKRKKGIQPPKGVLLCGIPGCGKSEAAKMTAKTFGLPLLQMDIGKLMGKYVGESEHNLSIALQIAEAMSPCILWIDELDKGFSAAGSSDDSGPFKRMFGTLLSWMQDNKKPCFIFATANNIGGLPKEFFRSGRFEELFAVYLPTGQECAEIFVARMKKIQGEVLGATGSPVFEEDCLREELMLSIVNGHLVKNEVPRIVVGADIQKIVNMALIHLQGSKIITVRLWEESLIRAIEECTVYGDGSENLDSIAVGYCRMLRKGFKPTSAKVLFKSEDYLTENLPNHKADYQEKLEILQFSEEASSFTGYDQAVYRQLRARINELAPEMEKLEKQRMLMR